MTLSSPCRFLLPIAIAALSASAASADEARLPERKAGLWELATTMDEGLGPKDQTLTMCVDADMERSTAAAAADEHGQKCSKHEIRREGENTIVDMSCQFSSRHVVSRTEMSGDFKTAFLVKIDSTTSGEQNSKTVTVKRTIVQKGKYLGESCGDLVGGEAKAPDGTKVLVQ